MELSSSIASTAAQAQARLLRPPPGRRPALQGCVSFRCYAVRSRGMKLMSPMGAGLHLAFPQQSSFQATDKKKCYVPCYQRQQAPQIEAKSMEEVYDALAEHLLSVLKNNEHLDSKYIVGLAGPPGAGKSTVASEVVQRVNLLCSQSHAKGSALLPTEEVAAVLPMDGFHLYRSQLDAMEDPKEAHARRGEGSVYAPSFDHGVGDPVENDIFVKPQSMGIFPPAASGSKQTSSLSHKIVIVEGNYILLDEDVWREIRALFDEKWFIDIDIDVSMKRVLKRHIATGKEPDVAAWRISYNDRPNAELIMESRKAADLVIRSVDFSS
ncbi:hypothetical protein ACP70R_033356 [Stipagrostis hirtigluma subsp. patula]